MFPLIASNDSIHVEYEILQTEYMGNRIATDDLVRNVDQDVLHAPHLFVGNERPCVLMGPCYMVPSKENVWSKGAVKFKGMLSSSVITRCA